MFFIVIGQENPGDQFALLRVSLHDCGKARLGRFEGMAVEIEPEPALSFLLIRPVTMKAPVRQDRADITIKLQPFLPPGKGYAKTEKNKGEKLEKSKVEWLDKLETVRRDTKVMQEKLENYLIGSQKLDLMI